MRSMEQNLKSIQGLSGQKSVSYADLCMFPHVHLPLGFKTPKFEKYDGHNDPTAHLKRYCNQLRGVGGKEELLMAYFGESLFQYNIDIAPDRNSLTNLKKKSSESFQEYAIKWREQDSRVKPPMDEVEMVTVFLQAQEADYFQNMMSAMGKPFAKAIKIGEMVENGKIVLRDEDIPNVTNNPLPAHNNGPVIGIICEDKEFDPALKAIIAIADVKKKSKTAPKQDKGEKKNKTTPPKSEKKIEVETGATPPKDVVLYVPRGCKEKQMTLSPPRRLELNKTTQIYVPKGAYVMLGPINPPRLSEPVVIRRAPQKPMTNLAAVPWNYNKSVVTFNGKEISGKVQENNPVEKYFNLEEVNNATRKRFPSKKPVSAEEADAFFQKMKMADYEVIDQLRKSSAQVSLLSLLMNSTEHQKVLIKTLNEAYVPVETSVEQLERMAERFFAINLISFTKNDLPPEGAAHNKTLHLTVKCEGHGYKLRKGLGKSLQGIAEPITLTASEKFFGVGFRPTPADIRWANDRKNDGWVLPQPVPHLYRTFVKPKYNEEKEDEAFTVEEIEEICGAMRKILYETHMVQLGEGSITAEVLSNNAALNNMTCLQTSCPDPYMLSNCDIMNQEPEYNEEEAFREIKRELEQFENKPKTNLNDTEPVNLGSSEEVKETKISIFTGEKTRDALIQLLLEFKDVFAWSYDDMLGLSVDLVVHKFPTYPDCPPVQQKQRKFKTDVSDKIKEEVTKKLKAGEYLSNPPVLVPPEPERPLFLYLTVLENSFGCILRQYDVTEKREHAIYYLNKKFTSYEAKYTLLERTCCALTWVAQKLRHYLQAYTTYLITRLDPLKYIFQKLMPTGRLAKWQILLTEFDIVYVTRTTMKAQALADHLAENPVDDEYQPLNTYFPDEEVLELEQSINAWKMFFDGAVNAKGVGIGAILISPTGQHYPATARLRFFYTNNTAEYEAYIMGMNIAIDQDVEELEAKGKFAPNWKGPYIIRKILPRGVLYLGNIEGNDPEAAINVDAVKRKQCNPKQPCKKQVQPKGNAHELKTALQQ
ncbi:uncharacterized protein [Nicotiana sylvestris]|uniref:uncharacterized protein n=1 Tax=Nicotiana sylvestris TaxID=4096 RepID=UPI00388CB30F